MTAKLEALVPWAQGVAGREVETLPREGEQKLKAPPHKGRCKPEALPPEVERERGAMQEGRRVHEPPPEAPLRKREREVDRPQPEALPQKGEGHPEALSRERECERARRGAKPKPKVEAPARKGERDHAKVLPPEGERKRGAMPQGNPNEGDREPSRPSRASLHEIVLSTWKGPGPWDPGGKSPRKQNFDSESPVEAKERRSGHRRPQQNKDTWPH